MNFFVAKDSLVSSMVSLRPIIFMVVSLFSSTALNGYSEAPSVQIGIDPGGENYRPHTFLIITHPDGSVVEYGLVPSDPQPDNWLDYRNWPGHIEKTGTGGIQPHEAEYYSNDYPLSGIEYQNLMNAIAADEANPSLRYSGLSLYGFKNCSRWAIEKLIRIGVYPGAFTFTGDPYYQAIISEFTNMYYILAGIIENLRDPLALDLNNDGIATVSANDGIMFDHNNAGIRYGTGWINPNDGWLALDRNGNGKIDSGRELFGDSTRKLDGNFAAHAYDALKSFDTNNDGKVDMADATGDADSSGTIDGSETYWDIDKNGEYDASVDKTFADLRVWVDANSNGNTDGGELKTLAELNIVSIGTGKTAVNVADENGNLNTFKGNYTNTSGELVDGTRSFNLLQNTFRRDWPDNVNISPSVAALPNMQGSGAVRNLHEAMSLGTAQSLALKTTVESFAAATTRGAQYALIDQLLMQWGSTSGFEDLAQRLENISSSIQNSSGSGVQNGMGSSVSFGYRVRLTTGEFWETTGSSGDRNSSIYLLNLPDAGSGSGAGAQTTDPDYAYTRSAADNLFVNNPEVLAGQTPTQAAKIQALAKVRVLEVFNNAQFFNFNASTTLSGADNPNTPQDDRIRNTLIISNNNTSQQSNGGPDSVAAVNTVVLTEDDFPIPQSNYLHASYDQLRESVYQALALQTRLKPYLDAIQITLNANGEVAFDFSAMNTALSSKLASEPVNGVLDLIDILKYRGADLEKSGWNAEAQFALIKTTLDSMSSAQRDNLAAAGFNMQYAIPNDSNLASEKTANVLALLSDTATTGSYIKGPVGNVIIGGAANENLIASCSSNVCGQGNDVLFGSAGNDGVHGNEGDDRLWGGAGNDQMFGETGDDYLNGGDGSDNMNGGEGNDWLVGGLGNDSLVDAKGSDVMQGSAGDDSYHFYSSYSTPGDLDTILFARGDGNDVINTAGKAVNQFAFIQFQAGIEPEHVKLRRKRRQLAFRCDRPRERRCNGHHQRERLF
jgi:hypothetical protein